MQDGAVCGCTKDWTRLAGYTLAGWSWGMWDWHWWQRPQADRLVERLAGKAKGGDIVVIHDGHHANPRADRRHAAETVRFLVARLRARGFTFAALCGRSSTPNYGRPATVAADACAPVSVQPPPSVR